MAITAMDQRQTVVWKVSNRCFMMSYMKLGLFLLCLLTLTGNSVRAQQKAFNGFLTDVTGKPVKRARIWVRSSNDFALTDAKGRFGLTNVNLTDTLHVSVKRQVYAIPIMGRKSMRIVLMADSKHPVVSEDQQLVDLGFGFVQRREHTGVSNYISGDDLRRSGQSDVLSALQGRVPGLNINSIRAKDGEQQVNIRGDRSFTASSTPLFLIDTVVVPSFEGLSLNDVDYVEIMKDASVYGSNGANGAIIVHTMTARKI